jgi:hypothetical protein
MEAIKMFNLYIRSGKAYIPSMAKSDVGVYIEIEPVAVVDLKFDDLLAAIGNSVQKGNPTIPHPSWDEMKTLPQPVLKAAKVRSWRQFVQKVKVYSIEQNANGFELKYFERAKKGNGFFSDNSRTKKFSRDTALQEIVQAVLLDVQEHPELLS